MNTSGVKSSVVDDHSLGTHYADGVVIFKEGDPPDGLYVVQAGKVRIVSMQPSGKEIEIAVTESGEVFGITSLFGNYPRSAAAITVGKTSVLRLGKGHIVRAIHNDPSLVFFLLHSLCHRAKNLKRDLVLSEARHLESDHESREDK